MLIDISINALLLHPITNIPIATLKDNQGQRLPPGHAGARLHQASRSSPRAAAVADDAATALSDEVRALVREVAPGAPIAVEISLQNLAGRRLTSEGFDLSSIRAQLSRAPAWRWRSRPNGWPPVHNSH